MYEANIIADSISENGYRLTTMEVTYPLIVHAEILTHRVFSRNVASNRAIPTDKMIESVELNPFIPELFPKNKSGMQNDEWLEGISATNAKTIWIEASKNAVKLAKWFEDIKVHKQISNRLLAPFLWTTAVITATDWKNFFSLRCHEDAQPEIEKISSMMRKKYESNTPILLKNNDWHLPYISDADKFNQDNIELLKKISIGRCARVSYLTQNRKRPFEKDIELFNKLLNSRHLSPFEHIATPMDGYGYCGNLNGWNVPENLLKMKVDKIMNIDEIINKRDKLNSKLEEYNKAIRAIQLICEHEDCYKCSICQKIKFE